MRDVLHPESAAVGALAATVGRVFEGHGYDLVTTPPFEHAEVLERGLSTLDRRDLVRFVEPETGEVALLRPDITPQIARIVATRLSGRPPPHRLRYHGTVVRRRHSRARKHRQIAQAGIEHVGTAGADADAEVLILAARACEAVGLDDFRIELAHARIARAALETLPSHVRARAATALSRKDVTELADVLRGRDLARPRRLLMTLADLYGDGVERIIRRAKKLDGGPAIGAALVELEEVVARATALGLADRLLIDLGELRGMSYYTGVSFCLLGEGPGQAVGAGGRYDDLLGKFEAPAPATGFAMDLDNLEWALTHAGRTIDAALPLRLVLAGADADAGRWRALGATVAVVPARTDALAFARAWSYDCALVSTRTKARAHRVSDGSGREVGPPSSEELRALERWAHDTPSG
jgi:ATP phosphoribosyltransferase regulatory subunit